MRAVIGHDAILRELDALASEAPPAHALLLVGPESTGRTALARHYAALLCCERRPGPAAAPQGGLFGADPAAPGPGDLPCGSCRACRHIFDGQHPDVVVLTPGDTLCKPRAGEAGHEAHPLSRDIRICQVRGTIELAARYPFEAPYRVVIIDPAERLNEAAANALLKTLEEPPPHTVFVLLSAAPESVIETIVSRCRRIDVGTVARGVIEAGLVERGIDPAVAAQAAAASRGRPGLAIAFAARPDLIGDRARVFERCARNAAASVADRLRYTGDLHELWRRDRSLVHAELDCWEIFWEERLRAAVREGPDGHAQSLACTAALRAVSAAREQLLANVLARTVFDLMLLSFPRPTLEEAAEEPVSAHA